MTIAELISELRDTKDRFDWAFHGNDWIRAVLKDSDIKASFDPVTAVCFVKTQKVVDDPWIDGCVTLGLSSGDCIDILEAAHNRRVDDIYNEWLRRQLVHAVGLRSPQIPTAALETIFDLVFARI